MSDLLGLTVAELLTTARERGARVPFEIGAFIALEACEAVIDEGAARLSKQDVHVGEDGAVSLMIAPNTASSEEAAESVIALLAALLVAAGQGVPPMLMRIVEEGPGAGLTLNQLRDELEASLVPLNRRAAKRVLSRQLRDLGRPSKRPSRRPPGLTESEVDADLDALLGSPEGSVSVPKLDAEDLDVMAGRSSRPPRPLPPSPAQIEAGVLAAAVSADAEGADEGAQPSAPRVEVAEPAGRAPDLSGLEEGNGGGKNTAVLVTVVSLLLIGAVIAGVVIFRPDLVQRLRGEAPAATSEPAEAPLPTPEPPTPAAERYGDIVIRVGTERAQIFRAVGVAPVEVANLPVGVAHEFLAVAEGRAPARALVPADVTWTEADGGARYELAMQAGEREMAFEQLRVGASEMPRDPGEPSGQLGTVRVITNPPGARVYQLVGFAPSARLRNVEVAQAQEFLVASARHDPQVLRVDASQYQDVDGTRVVELDVTLRR